MAAKGKPTRKRSRKSKATQQEERAGHAAAVIAELEREDEESALVRGSEGENVQRDNTIFRAAFRGVSATTLAYTYGLSDRQVRRIIAQQRDGVRQAVLQRGDPLKEVNDYLWLIDGVIDELASVSAREKGSVRVTAILGRLTALKERRDVLQSVGILPHDLGTLKQIADLALLARNLMEIFERGKVPEKIWVEVEVMLKELSGQPELIESNGHPVDDEDDVVDAEVVDDDAS